MRSIIKIAATALAILVPVHASNAQVLKKLGQTALNAAEKAVNSKIEGSINKTIDNAADKLTGKKPANNNSSNSQSAQPKPQQAARNFGGLVAERASSQGSSKDDFQMFMEELAAPMSRSEINDLPDVDESGFKPFNSASEAAKAFPALPTKEQIVDRDSLVLQSLFQYQASLSNLMTTAALMSASDYGKPREASKPEKSKVTEAQKKQMNASAMEMFALMQKYNIDPDNMSEKELFDFFQQKAASGELSLPDGMKAGDLVYEEEEEDEFDKIQARLSAVEDKTMSLSSSLAGVLGDPFGVEKKLNSAYSEIRSAWFSSDAAKKAYEIEDDITRRVYESLEADNGATLVFPEFWSEGRRKENALIRDFNLSQIGAWVDILNEALDANISILQELGDIDADIESMITDKNDVMYASLKMRCNSSAMMFATSLSGLLMKAFEAPVVSRVAESREIIQ